MTDGFEACFESGNADGGGSHVNTPPRLPQVKGHTNHADLLRHDAGERSSCRSHKDFPISNCQFPICVKPIFTWQLKIGNWHSSRVQPVQHSWERDGFANVFEAADPCYRALNAHAEAGVRNATILAQVQIPLERLFRQPVFV